MPRNRFKKIAEESRERTNAQLREELSRFTSLTEDQLQELLPRKGDKEAFAELMKIVNSSARQNTKLKQLKDNIEKLGPAALKVLKALAP